MKRAHQLIKFKGQTVEALTHRPDEAALVQKKLTSRVWGTSRKRRLKPA